MRTVLYESRDDYDHIIHLHYVLYGIRTLGANVQYINHKIIIILILSHVRYNEISDVFIYYYL